MTFDLAIFAGPSGGHLFPAEAFAVEWRKRHRDAKIILVTGKKGGRFVPARYSEIYHDVLFLNDFPFPRGISFSGFDFLLKLLRSFSETRKVLNRYRPDMVAGFGSYISYPGVLLAKMRKIPVILHEQNVFAGMATRKLLRYADAVGVSFKDTDLPVGRIRREWVGLPLRTAVVGALKGGQRREKEAGVLTILVVGGSQGAQRINRAVIESFGQFSREELSKIAVIHSTGENDLEWVAKAYRGLGMKFETHKYLEDIGDAYGKADIAISRAGASTLFELAAFGIPSIVVPYPHAESHQLENVRRFSEGGAMILCQEKDLDDGLMFEHLQSLIRSPDRREVLSAAVRKMATPDAAENLTELAEDILNLRRKV